MLIFIAISLKCYKYMLLQGTLIGLAAFSQDRLLSMLRSASLLSSIAYAGQMTSPLATNGADQFLADINIIILAVYL